MSQHDGSAARFHSPMQVEHEYICDMVDNPKWWIPASARNVAAAYVLARGVSNIINGNGIACGTNRPF